jgi:pentatricopeptide repeat protein
MRADLTSATVEDVCEWVGSLGLDEYVATFQHHGIDGSQLIQLTDDHLRIELGISKIGHRARIRRERDALVSRSKTGTGNALVARPPPSAPAGSGRVKVSIRVGAAGQWVNIRLTQAELQLAELKRRLASALNMDEAAIERLQYRSGADWFAVLRDQDILDCVADNGGDSLVLQVGDEGDRNGAENFDNSASLALVEPSGDGELSVVESKEQVNLLWHGVTWHQRLRALLARGEVQEALDALLEWHGARAAMAQSPAAVYNALLKLVNDTQLPSAVAITAYELMRSRGIKPNAATYDHLLRALIRDGKPEVAARVLVSMDKTGHRPDSSAYNGIMQSLADRGGRGDLTMALQIGAKGLEIEMELTVFTFNKLLAACTRDGATDEGVSAFKLLQKSGQTPDEESYASLLACCCMGSDVALSMKAMQGMINAGYSPKMNLVNRILGACTTSEQASKVFKIVGDLPDVQLNSRSYAELMRCVRTEGNLELGVRSLKSALRAGVYLDGDVVGSIIDMAVESVDKAEQDRVETMARLQEQTEARKRAELAQEESEQARLNALALAKANKDEATSWREQAAAAEDAAAEAVGSFDKFESEWQWMESITQDEVETRASAVFAENVAIEKQTQADARAEEEIRMRVEAEDLKEAAERARLVSESNEQDAIAEAASWRETALVAENAMEDMASAPFETPAQEWQWMEASIQDEVSLRAVAEAAREHAEKVQAAAEEEARSSTIDKLEAENASEKDQRARLVAEASEKAAKEETETWRSTAMAAEVAVAEALESNATTVVDEWGFMEALMTDEAQSHAVVQIEYDTVMEKLGAAAASGTLSAEDAKALAQSELDARLAAEKEATAAKEQLTAAELRWRTAVESAEARATEAEKRMIAAEKRSTDSEKQLRTETERLRDHAERSVAEAQRSVQEAEAHKKLLELQAQEEIQARKTAEATAAARAAEVEAARKEAANAEAAGAAKAKQAHEAAAKAAEDGAPPPPPSSRLSSLCRRQV